MRELCPVRKREHGIVALPKRILRRCDIAQQTILHGNRLYCRLATNAKTPIYWALYRRLAAIRRIVNCHTVLGTRNRHRNGRLECCATLRVKSWLPRRHPLNKEGRRQSLADLLTTRHHLVCQSVCPVVFRSQHNDTTTGSGIQHFAVHFDNCFRF